jgi:hypothetical protein
MLLCSSVSSPIVILSQSDTLDLAHQFERNKLFTYKQSVRCELVSCSMEQRRLILPVAIQWTPRWWHGWTETCFIYRILQIFYWGTPSNSIRSWCLTLILVTWRIWWAPNNASRWQVRLNSAFKGIIVTINYISVFGTYVVRIRTWFLAVVNDILFSTRFEARSPNCEKRLRAASCLSVCMSVRVERLGSHLADFHEILHLRIFLKYVELFYVLLTVHRCIII